MSDKKYGFVTKAAVLSVALLMYTTATTTPALGAIAKAFPDVSPDTVKQIASLPSLMMIAGSLLTGQLERFMTKKAILYVSMTVQLVAGIIPAFYGDMALILVCRAFFGVGYGLVFPLASSLIADLFDGRERDTLMGLKSAVGAAAGIVFQMLGAYLAVISWRHAFLGFLLIIPIFLMIFFKLPEPEKKTAPMAADGAVQARLTPATWYICLLNLIYNLIQFSFMTNVAIVMTTAKIGNAMQAGMVLTAFTAAAFVAGLAYGKVAQVFKRYTVALAVGLVGLAFLMLLNVDTYALFLVAGAIFGLGFGTYNPAVTLLLIGTAHKSAATLALSFFVALMGVGQFLSPIALGFLTKMLGFAGPLAAWQLAAPACLAAAVILTLAAAFNKPKHEGTVTM
ncbi:MFS transporter [Sporomusa aerivorans]|uniref:MFS transporter n=1 Tax=Sporomusa aerivorans TaxID=204936 RepID=UPI00352B1844